MKTYLKNKVGQKLGVIRAGMPKEVYFEATLKEVGEDTAVFEDKDGDEIALPLDKILLIGPPEESGENAQSRAGFF